MRLAEEQVIKRSLVYTRVAAKGQCSLETVELGTPAETWRMGAVAP